MLKTTTKTLYPELVDNLIANSLDFVKKYTDYLTSIGSIESSDSSNFQSQMTLALNFQKALRSNDPITSLKEFFTNLNDSQCSNLNNDFIFYWFKKFQNTFLDVQTVFSTKEDVFFKDISDSIGLIANFAAKYTDNVSPLTDMSNKNNPPSQLPVTVINKLSPATLNLHNKLNNLTSILQKNNLINIQKVQSGQYSLSNLNANTTTSHGANLITDLKFYSDFYEYLPNLVNKIYSIFSNTLTFITYFSNINDKTGYNSRNTINNLQKMTDITFKSRIENIDFTLDVLQKQIKGSLSDKTIKDTIGVVSSRRQATASTTSVNNKFLNKDKKPDNFIPASDDIIAKEREKAAAEEIKQPNKEINNLNLQVQRLGMPSSTSNKNTKSPLTSTVNNKEVVKEQPKNNSSSNIPEISALASNASNFNSTDPQAILTNIESLKDIYCNFKLPDINQGDLKNLTSGDITANAKQLANILLGLIPKVTLPKLDDYTQAMKQLVESLDPEKIWKSFYSKLFECKNKKDY